MYEFLFSLLNIGCIFFLAELLFAILLIYIKKKISFKIWRILCFVPLLIGYIHFKIYYLHASIGFQINNFGLIYLFPIIVLMWQFMSTRPKIYNISVPLVLLIGMIFYGLVFFKNLKIEMVHNLTNFTYTESFYRTINILKKEYSLTDYKEIDYEYLYNKYYPNIKKAERNNDEQLYFKTMFEFSKNFKDGHFSYVVDNFSSSTNLKENDFLNDYVNKNYGFASILLTDGRIAAILVDKNSSAYKQGLRDGMIISKKDNIEITKQLDNVITPYGGYPVSIDEKLINSFYLFTAGNNNISVSFINEQNIETTIDVSSISNVNYKADYLYSKILYFNYDLENHYTKMLDENTGYININSESYNEFYGAIGNSSYVSKIVKTKLVSLEKKGMKNLVIDLRTNSGGYLAESEGIASLFTNDNYLVTRTSKYGYNLYDESYLKGNGKYANMDIIVLVNSNTVSAGDLLTYMLSKCENVQIIGFTNSNNSVQSMGGKIFLSGGTSYINYPIYNSYNKDENILIDTNSSGNANLKLDYRVPLTQDSISYIINEDDYLLDFALNKLK